MKLSNFIRKLVSFFSIEIITFIFLTAAVLLVLVNFTDLRPRVDENFFFSTEDPQFQQEKRISALFERKDTQLIISAQGKITSDQYVEKIKQLSEQISAIPGVVSVLSLTQGPGNLRSAIADPLWKRLLVSGSTNASNIIIIVEEARTKQVIRIIEQYIDDMNSENFKLLMSGAPYIVELIERNLVHDFRTFSFLAFGMFALIILLIFQSIRILIGTLISCLNAGVITLIIISLFNIQIGLLTANLATIVFVLTLSHIVYLTYNWKHLHAGGQQGDGIMTQQAVNMTFSPSFWSMVTTVLGFLTLLTVPAKPLQELGVSGAIGSFMSMLIVYTMYPAFLKQIEVYKDTDDAVEHAEERIYQQVKGRNQSIVIFLIGLGILVASGLTLIRHDPSIFSYFSKRGEIAGGLRYIDHQGGSSPMIIVIRSEDQERLNTNRMFDQMWELQLALEQHDAVGTLISLPVLMAQVRQTPFSFFLSWEWIFEIMEGPDFQEIANTFITENRRYGLFLFRMKEFDRQRPRLEIVNELQDIIQDHGFVPELVGGIYVLQGYMSQLVAQSLINGLTRLLLLFFVIGWAITRSFKTGLAMVGSISAVPIIVLGVIGLIQVPFDVIAAPAINIAIAMGIDAMIHMVQYWKRVREDCQSSTEAWEKVRAHLWKPIINAMLVIVFGFGIFFFSQFPPTQRFGAIIVFGVIFSALCALFLFPWGANIGKKR